ncbi:MAG TPA: DEAD/DEAH box helicase [Thermoplasmata archaeon]
MRVADVGLDPRIVEILKKQGIEELYPPQAEAIGPALLGENLVLAIPTASGKSLVAYLAILASVLRGGKALYIVPLRALAAEKYEDLKEFESLGLRVGISVGDYDSIDPSLERFDVIVATSERADSLLRHRINWLQQLTVVVADEVHLINDGDRGPTLEVTLAKLRQVNPKAQVLALSATIKNSGQLAKWLEAEHVKSEWRPVPLKEGVYHEGLVHFVDQSVQEVKAGEDDISGLVTDIMASGGQALIFVNTRRSTEALAKALASHVRDQLGEKRHDQLKKVAEGLAAAQDEPTSMGARLARCIESGVAFHNAGLTNAQRGVVEKEFRKGRIACIVATPTLCLHPDTMITTQRGPVPISRIRKGDMVLTDRGVFRKVLGTSRRSFAGDLIEIKADGMVPVLMTPGHRVLTNTQYRYGYHAGGVSWHEIRRSEPVWVTARRLAVGDQVQSPVECPWSMADGGSPMLQIHRREFVGRNQFGSVFPHPNAIPVPQQVPLDGTVARFLGLYAAEGYTGRNGIVGFAVATSEEGLTRFITSTMRNVFHAMPRISDTTRHRRNIRCCSRAMAQYFDEAVGRGAANKHFPEELLSAPPEIIERLLRGLYEGDGAIQPSGANRARLTTVSPRLADQVVRMLKRLGYMPSVSISPPHGIGKRPQYHVKLSGRHGVDFLTSVMGLPPAKIRLGNRTYNTKEFADNSFRSTVRRIRKVPYSGPVYNLHVHGDQSYTCAFGFVVHNSAGINLPARRVIIRDLNRFDVNFGLTPIPVLEIKQMCGRAGRPKYDKYGEAILFAKDIDEIDDLMDEYFRSEPEAIESKLGSEPALRMHVLASVATGHVNSEEDLLAFFNRTFFAFTGDVHEIHGKIREVLDFLEKEDFITRRDGFLKATFFGKRTSDLYIDPLSAVKMRDALREARDDALYHLWTICSTPDMPKLYLRRGDYAWVEQKIEEADLTFPVEDYDFFLAEVKTASLLHDWIAERTEEEVTKKFGIGPGDVRRMTDQGEWLLYSMAELGKIFNKKKVRALTRLTIQVQYGVKEELLELISLRGVGRVRGRALFQRGFKTLKDLQKANPNDLARIPTIGPTLAVKIKEQVGAPVDVREVEGQAALGDFT